MQSSDIAPYPHEINLDEVQVIKKPYASKKIYRDNYRNKCLLVSLTDFSHDIHLFDREMAERYTSAQRIDVMKLIFKKCVLRIVKNLWRMPFPNGIGTLYMAESQKKIMTPDELREFNSVEKSLIDTFQGMRRVYLKWNKRGLNFIYRHIWKCNMSKGYFRSVKWEEIMSRAEDDTKKNYRAHII